MMTSLKNIFTKTLPDWEERTRHRQGKEGTRKAAFLVWAPRATVLCDIVACFIELDILIIWWFHVFPEFDIRRKNCCERSNCVPGNITYDKMMWHDNLPTKSLINVTCFSTKKEDCWLFARASYNAMKGPHPTAFNLFHCCGQFPSNFI